MVLFYSTVFKNAISLYNHHFYLFSDENNPVTF